MYYFHIYVQKNNEVEKILKIEIRYIHKGNIKKKLD